MRRGWWVVVFLAGCSVSGPSDLDPCLNDLLVQPDDGWSFVDFLEAHRLDRDRILTWAETAWEPSDLRVQAHWIGDPATPFVCVVLEPLARSESDTSSLRILLFTRDGALADTLDVSVPAHEAALSALYFHAEPHPALIGIAAWMEFSGSLEKVEIDHRGRARSYRNEGFWPQAEGSNVIALISEKKGRLELIFSVAQ